MTKNLYFAVILASFLAIAGNVSAMGKAVNKPDDGQQATPVQTQAQVQTQTQAQDQTAMTAQGSEEPQKIQAQVRTQTSTQNQQGIESRSNVANAVQEMLQLADRNGGIGEQVRAIAQEQNQNQEKLDNSIEKIQNRNQVARFLFGANYQEVKDAKKILQQNRDRLMELEQLKAQIANAGDAQTLTNQIQALEQNNNQMENTLNESEKGFSLFGWLVKLFTK